jgi:hypothetical protein
MQENSKNAVTPNVNLLLRPNLLTVLNMLKAFLKSIIVSSVQFMA